ncbi:hypothetical protein SAY87_029108 [Trapa incisa]|uniref:Serine/threonine-protein phosphatase n=1 Tax=Trapa incisa TaxID=236973 RepID=A0AAN7KZ17_9MYRT|nr:hypothetical protein SAY87_029108 [Trapa incisa]
MLDASSFIQRGVSTIWAHISISATAHLMAVRGQIGVHGQLHDVMFLSNDAGFPGEERIFVFNGDYVDRGAWVLETFLLLLAWKVFMPDRLYLLRGNHESKYCTSVYGFEKEVTKYGGKGKQVYRKCFMCFEGLHLASIIGERDFGLFRGIPITSSRRSKGKKNSWLIIRSHEGSDAREKRPGLAGMDHGYTIDHVVELGNSSLSLVLQTILSFRQWKKGTTTKGHTLSWNLPILITWSFTVL